jgi:hypothetical protein
MATYDSLTAEEKEKLAFTTTQERAVYAAFARFLDNLDDLKVHYTAAGVGAILAKLDAGAVVPNASGLAGSQALTKEEWQTAASDMNSLLTAWWTDAKRQVFDKMAGPVNTSR